MVDPANFSAEKNSEFYFFYFSDSVFPTHTPYFTYLFSLDDNSLTLWLKVVKYATMYCLFRVLSLSLYIERMNSINFKRNYL